jgi:hypothetical protein
MSPWREGSRLPHFERAFVLLFQEQLAELLHSLVGFLLMHRNQFGWRRFRKQIIMGDRPCWRSSRRRGRASIDHIDQPTVATQ